MKKSKHFIYKGANKNKPNIDFECSKCYNAFMKNYQFESDIKLIRKCLGLSQDEFAKEVLLSRSNIARYESGAIIPRKDSCEKIYNYAFKNAFNINKSKAMLYEDNKADNAILFHGSRNEIIGEVDINHSIAPNDFGDGFYLGQTLKQANMWVATNKDSSTYCFYFKTDKTLKSLSLKTDYDWMLLILYYRGALEGYKKPKRLTGLISKIENVDYIVAPIADNQMYDTLEMFRNNIISDTACLHALSANNLGRQYVLKTMKACKCLECVDRFYLCEEERNYYLNLKKESYDEGKSKTSLAIAKYRKEGKLFNEIFKKER